MTQRPFNPEQFSTRPGVYLMKGEDGTVLYVGKAKNLRARLRNYLRAEQDSRPQIRFLLERVKSVETIVTDTEKEALILENTLIKEHRPRYNIHLRDDKTYVSIRLDPRETFPALQVVRKVIKDGALYFGPFSSSLAVRETLKHIYRIFPLRHHSVELCSRRRRPCLFYQIGQCSGPCHGKITVTEYAELVRGAIALLSGHEDEVVKRLRQEMLVASAALRFEEATALRNRIAAIEKTVERQKVLVHGGADSDVFGLYGDGKIVAVVVLLVRKGRLLDRRSYRIETALDEQELLSMVVQQFYAEADYIPEQVFVPSVLEDAPVLAEWLAEKRGGRVMLATPRRGEKSKLIELAQSNAEEYFGEEAPEMSREATLREINERLGLHRTPHRMECFDISNIQGTAVVGSMVVFIDGCPAKDQYRRYEVESVAGAPDDYASMREVLSRRLKRGMQEGNLPDFILVDGGKGQLAILTGLLSAEGLTDTIEIASIAKARPEKKEGIRTLRGEERFFRPGSDAPIILAQGSSALKTLARMRDEAHRFAVAYHRKKRDKSFLQSELAKIPGVGAKRRLALLRHFGSVQRMREATVEDFAQVSGIGPAGAQVIFDFFRTADV